ncbi:MAG: UDP-N-acetylmuramate--L-alanine ligase [Parcubacteria group bacterium]
MNLNQIKKAYFIGIKGAGMTAVAEILKARGIEISGSDTKEKFFTDEILKRNNIKYFEEFKAGNIPEDVDLIIYSTAYSENNNTEMLEARKRGLNMLSYPEVLGLLFKEKLGIAVCGTHGKTTTTAILASCLKEAGTDPTAIVGSKAIDWDSSSLNGKGNFFVAEADEYQNKLKYYNPWAVVLTSVDWDHPDFFPTFEEYKKAFRDFVEKIPKHGFLVVCGDDADAIEAAKNASCQVITYGFADGCDYRIEDLSSKNWSEEGELVKTFKFFYKEEFLEDFGTKIIGRHNMQNAAAAIAVCHKLKLDLEKVKNAILNFHGTSRRFEKIGERGGAILIDDYAHHPEEIKATLKAAREKYYRKNIWTVFHPHTFTRTKALFHEFAQSFDNTDKVIVIDIYGSAREEQGGVSSKDLVDLINRYNPGKAEYVPTIPEVVEFLKNKISGKDLVISMGAGNVWEVTKELAE